MNRVATITYTKAGMPGLEAAQQMHDLPIGRSEVVTPGGDAMRLIDDQEPHRKVRQNSKPFDVIQVLGRDEKEPDPATSGCRPGRVILVVSLIAVDAGRRQSETLIQMPKLVTHQRQQRRDDQRDAVQQGSRNLIE